jgi:hypothetical protein
MRDRRRGGARAVRARFPARLGGRSLGMGGFRLFLRLRHVIGNVVPVETAQLHRHVFVD